MSDKIPQIILMGNLISAAPRRNGTLTSVLMELPGGVSSGGGSIYAGAVMGAIIGSAIDG